MSEFSYTEEERQKAVLGLVDGPVWPDECGHGGYITSYRAAYAHNGKLVVEKIDLYVFGDGQVCMRFGVGGDYHSARNPVQLIKGARDMDQYARAVEILEAFGQFAWVPKSKSGKVER